LLVGDRAAFDLADMLYSDAIKDVVVVITALGAFPVVALVVAATTVWAAMRRRYVEAAVLPVSFLLTWLAVDIATAAFDRPRPAGSHVETDGASYPSAHAAYSVAWVACAVVFARTGGSLPTRFAVVTAAVVVAVVIGLTRVYLRAHYLSDVDGGWGLGATIFALLGIVALVVGRLRQNGQPQP
jgi:undecaprenyl-diphosphatase